MSVTHTPQTESSNRFVRLSFLLTFIFFVGVGILAGKWLTASAQEPQGIRDEVNPAGKITCQTEPGRIPGVVEFSEVDSRGFRDLSIDLNPVKGVECITSSERVECNWGFLNTKTATVLLKGAGAEIQALPAPGESDQQASAHIVMGNIVMGITKPKTPLSCYIANRPEIDPDTGEAVSY